MKYIILTLLVFLLTGAASAFAAGPTKFTGGSSAAIGTSSGTFAPSTNVYVSAFATTTAYTAASSHINGNIAYATAGGAATVDTTKLYSATCSGTCGGTDAKYPATSATALPTGSSAWQ